MTPPATRCTACKEPFDLVRPSAPMVHDAIWAKLAKKDEHLCARCFFQRVRERQIEITRASLRPCGFNLFHRPYWFDLFSREGETQADIEAWLEEAERPLRED